MNIQVEPQMQHRSRNTARAFIRVSIREPAGKGNPLARKAKVKRQKAKVRMSLGAAFIING
jgi:hypothetical protein